MFTAVILAAVAVFSESPAQAEKRPDAGGIGLVRVQISATAVAFSPDSQTVAFGGQKEGTITLCRTRDGKPLRTFRQTGEEGVLFIEFSSDGKLLETWSLKDEDGSVSEVIRLWDLSTGKVRFSINLPNLDFRIWPMRTRACSPDKSTLALSRNEPAIRLVDTRTGKESRKLLGHKSKVSVIVFSPDGKRAASADEGGIAILWDITAGKELRRRKWDGETITSLRFMGDRLLAAMQIEDREKRPSCKLWDFAEPQPLVSASNSASGPISADGRFFIFARMVGHAMLVMEVWDVKDPKNGPWTAGPFSEIPPALAPDGRMIAVFRTAPRESPGDPPGSNVTIGELPSGKSFGVIPLQGRGHAAAIAPDGKTLAITSEQHSLLIRLDSFQGRAGSVTSFTFSPNGKFLAVSYASGKVDLWDGANGKRLRTLREEKGLIEALVISPGGEFVAAASGGKVSVWTADTGKLRYSLDGVKRPIRSLSFASDGQSLLARYPMKTIGWDLETGRVYYSRE